MYSTQTNKNILNNKYILYFVLFLAVSNILGYLMYNKLNFIFLFIIIGLLTYQFTKNMIIVLLIPILLTNFLVMNKNMRETLENMDQTNNVQDINDDKLEVLDPKLKKGMDILKISKDVPEAKARLEKMNETNSELDNEMTNLDVNIDNIPKTQDPNNLDMNQYNIEENTPTGININTKKTNKNHNETSLTDIQSGSDKILNDVMLDKLTKDTQKLIEQQGKLVDSMENMTSSLDETKDMIKGFDLKNLLGLTGLATPVTTENFILSTHKLGTQKPSTKKPSGVQKLPTRKL
jgi:hypothetical protein